MRPTGFALRSLRAALLLALVLLLPSVAGASRIECRLEGVGDEELLRNIEATLSIFRDRDRDDLTPERIRQLHERAPMEIRRAVEPFGYYHSEIEGTLTPRGGDEFDARYVISLGEPVRVRRVNVSVTGEGRTHAPFPDLVTKFALTPGSVLDQRVYTRLKNAFATAATDSGYLDASFTASAIHVNREDDIADIDLVFATGPLYRFGPVTFDSTSVDERVLRSYLTFKRGEPFRFHELLSFQSALGGASYYSRVEAVPRRDLVVDQEIPIEVKLTARRPRRYEVGVGYGTDTGPRVLLNVEFRRLNHAGHRYTGRLNLSQVETSLNAEYVMPSRYPDVHAYSIGAVVARLDPVSYTTTRLAVGPTRSQPRFGWLESITMSYEHEDYTVGPDAGITDLVIAGITYRVKRSDDDILPTHGYRLDVGARGASEALLSSQSFVSLTGSAKGVRSLNHRVRVLARVDGGWTSTPSFRELPPTVRFFAGGDNSVRGYEYQSLGALADDGRVVGGDWLLTTSAEVEVAVAGKFGLAAFYDAGNAFSSLGEGVVEQGTGVGLRWRSPVGPIRLDTAFAVNHDDWRIHFTMGPDL